MLACVFVPELNDPLFDFVAVSTHVEMVVASSNDVLAAMRQGQRYDGKKPRWNRPCRGAA